MPLRVTVEVVPGGDEARAEVLHTLTITQVEKLDGDLRRYRCAIDLRAASVYHHRSEGALVLVEKALAVFTQHWSWPPR